MENVKKIIEAIDGKQYQVKTGAKLRLAHIDPDDEARLCAGGKQEAKEQLKMLVEELDELQKLLYASCNHKLLVVFQAMDTGGKDGTIRHVFRGINPQGVRVANFKVPALEEQMHDYLWRVHAQVPKKGEIVIFNRSHYEDVLVTRVHGLVSSSLCKKRYEHINDFERMLSDEGTVILKFFLYIDKKEQKKRLKERFNDPLKRWKLELGDLKERKLWDHYVEAYEDTLTNTSTSWAPWYIIPANREWHRNLLVAAIIAKQMISLSMKYPNPKAVLDDADIR